MCAALRRLQPCVPAPGPHQGPLGGAAGWGEAWRAGGSARAGSVFQCGPRPYEGPAPGAIIGILVARRAKSTRCQEHGARCKRAQPLLVRPLAPRATPHRSPSLLACRFPVLAHNHLTRRAAQPLRTLRQRSAPAISPASPRMRAPSTVRSIFGATGLPRSGPGHAPSDASPVSAQGPFEYRTGRTGHRGNSTRHARNPIAEGASGLGTAAAARRRRHAHPHAAPPTRPSCSPASPLPSSPIAASAAGMPGDGVSRRRSRSRRLRGREALRRLGVRQQLRRHCRLIPVHC